jgi:O-acetylserine/cysteine efflux transporter
MTTIELRAAGALMAAAAGWGSLSVTTTIALRGFGPMGLLVGELTVAVLVLVSALRLTGQRLPRLSPAIVVLGLLEPGIAFLTFNLGVQRTSSSHAGLLLGLETVFVVLLGAVVLRERPSATALSGMLLAVIGVALLSLHPGSGATVLGDALVLLDVLAAAASVILAARIVRDVPPLGLTAAQFTVGLVAVLPVAIHSWVTGAEPLPTQTGVGPAVAVLLTGSLGTAGAFMIYNWSLSRVSATAAGTAMTATPLFALALSALVLGETVTAGTALAVVLVLAGLTLFVMSGRRRRPVPG